MPIVYFLPPSCARAESGHTAADHWMQTGYAYGPVDSQGNPAQAAPFFGTVAAKLLGSRNNLPTMAR